MGRKMDALLGRGFKTSNFKTLAKLAVSRIAILKNQRQLRLSQARSDVIQLLNLGHQDRALLRVEHVIKQQNMLDVFAMIEHYFHLLIERVFIIQNKECPDELQEAISSLLFAASRCGEFPELQRICRTFTSRFGKEFAARAAELRNNCGVNPKMIQKFSARQPSLESRLKMLKEIASECGITLNLEEDDSVIEVEKQEVNKNHKQPADVSAADHPYKPESKDDEIRKYLPCGHIVGCGSDGQNELIESMEVRKKYQDVTAAAQEAFELADCVAAAARAAVVLSCSRAEPRVNGRPDDPDNTSINNVLHHQQLIIYGSSSTANKSSIHSESEGEEETETNHGKNERELILLEGDKTTVSQENEPCRDIILYGSYN